MTTPTTAAGRARRMLVEALVDGGLPEKAAGAHVAAFEAEARAAALADVARTLVDTLSGRTGHAACYDAIEALAAIDALRERSGAVSVEVTDFGQQSRAAALAEARAAVGGRLYPYPAEPGFYIDYQDALAAIDALRERDGE